MTATKLIPRILTRAAGALLALLPVSCMNTPSPLAPGLSGSVGAPNYGVLTEAEELPLAGRGFSRLRPHAPNHFGTKRLVSGLERVAAELSQSYPDAPPLMIGDLSARRGGKIPGHASHRTGRDVDLLFFYKNPRGMRVQAPGFVHVESDGIAVEPDSGDYYVLDVDREWELVKLLVSDRELAVQFIFVSRTVEALLIEHALARGEPLELIWHAQAVMLEPGDSTPHDDHTHVRLACAPDETVLGCSGGGPIWQWLAPPPAPKAFDLSELSQVMAEDPLDPELLLGSASANAGGS